MSEPLRIGNAHGFWGDRLDAAADMLAREPDLDFLTLDFLAEISMSILAAQQSRDPAAGFPKDILEIVRSLGKYWRAGGACRLITNAGGLNPAACARACREVLRQEGCGDRTIAAVSGDDVLEMVRAAAHDGDDRRFLNHLETGEPLGAVVERLVTANAYLGAEPVAAALDQGADIVITGRVADPSLAVAAAVHHFGWSWDDWDRLAAATVAGHLIECGTQVTGGISTDWLQVPGVESIGFPIAELSSDGGCVITKPAGSGGCVTEATVKEQLLYEIGDPDNYLSPDVTLSFLSLEVEQVGTDRVGVRGARGRAAPASYKVSATLEDGFKAAGTLCIGGPDAVVKARRSAAAVLGRLEDRLITFREVIVECLGGNGGSRSETVLRIAVADDSAGNVEQFARELMSLITSGPQGTTGYAAGRPRVHPLYRYWPCLIPRSRVQPGVELLEPAAALEADATGAAESNPTQQVPSADDVGEWRVSLVSQPSPCPDPQRRLADIAYARSGDKGTGANIGVIARRPDDFQRLSRELTAQRVGEFLDIDDPATIHRFELPNLGALNFLIDGILDSPLRNDAQGKMLGQRLLQMPLGHDEEVFDRTMTAEVEVKRQGQGQGQGKGEVQ